MPVLVRIFVISLAVLCLKSQAQEDSLIEHRTRKPYLAPVILSIGAAAAWRDYGFVSRGGVYDWRQRNFSEFFHHADNYLQFLPIAAMFILDAGACAREGNGSVWKEHALLLAASQLIMSAIVYPVKEFTNVERPNGRNDKSFPSGHTAQAFLAATLLHRTYGQQYKWVSITGYSIAAATGIFRVLNNAHWITDVLAGAAVGIISVNLAQEIRIGDRRDVKLTMTPLWRHGPGLSVSLRSR